MDFLEDISCERIEASQLAGATDACYRELMKLVPENFKIMILPSYFNYTDTERIRTIMMD